MEMLEVGIEEVMAMSDFKVSTHTHSLHSEYSFADCE